jgi:hypothetical protein
MLIYYLTCFLVSGDVLQYMQILMAFPSVMIMIYPKSYLEELLQIVLNEGHGTYPKQ